MFTLAEMPATVVSFMIISSRNPFVFFWGSLRLVQRRESTEISTLERTDMLVEQNGRLNEETKQSNTYQPFEFRSHIFFDTHPNHKAF